MGGPQIDGEVDEFAVLLHQGLQRIDFQEIFAILFDVEDDLSSSPESVASRVLGHGEGTVGIGSPDVLIVCVVLGNDRYGIGYQEGGIESHSKLTYHGGIAWGLFELLQELCR